MSEVHISLSEFDAIRNSQREGQDRIKELEQIISEKDDLITKLESNSKIIIKTYTRYLKPIFDESLLFDIVKAVQKRFGDYQDIKKMSIALDRFLNHPETKFKEVYDHELDLPYRSSRYSEKFVGFEEVKEEIEKHFGKTLQEKIQEVENEKEKLRDEISKEFSTTIDELKCKNQKLQEQLDEAQEKLKEASKSHEEKLKEAEEKFKQAAAELNALKGKSFWQKLFS
jgi:uncharacterized protein YPO0396